MQVPGWAHCQLAEDEHKQHPHTLCTVISELYPPLIDGCVDTTDALEPLCKDAVQAQARLARCPRAVDHQGLASSQRRQRIYGLHHQLSSGCRDQGCDQGWTALPKILRASALP